MKRIEITEEVVAESDYMADLNFDEKKIIQEQLRIFQLACFNNAVSKGFHEDQFNFGEKIALVHEELSEALTGGRKGNPPSDKDITMDNGEKMSAVEEELADAVIRCFDLAGSLGYNLAESIIKKHEYNRGRPYKHGKKF